jgi:hypothetical protein
MLGLRRVRGYLICRNISGPEGVDRYRGARKDQPRGRKIMRNSEVAYAMTTKRQVTVDEEFEEYWRGSHCEGDDEETDARSEARAAFKAGARWADGE